MSQVQLFAVTAEGPVVLPVPAGASSIHDAFEGLPLGVYSALRTFEHNKFLWLEHHFERTDRSMALLGWAYRLDRPWLCRALDQVCSASPWPEARVRFDVLAEAVPCPGGSSRLLIALSPFTPVPAHYYEEGVAVALAPDLRREAPLVKQAHFVLDRRPYPLGGQEDYEYLLLDEAGRILEGSSSNFYAVRQGVLFTAGEGVLEGISRKIILRLVEELAIPLRLEAVPLAEVPGLEEASLSSASRGLLPVVRIAGMAVGNGRPGPVTQRLWAAYQRFVAGAIRRAV